MSRKYSVLRFFSKIKTVLRYTSCILRNTAYFLEYVDHDTVKRKKKK